MACPRYEDAIQELVDGTLGPIRRSELQIHLDQCDDCRALLRDLEQIRDLAGTLDRPLPPNRVWMQIAGQLQQEGRLQAPAPPPPRTRQFSPLLAMAAAVLLTVGASLVYWLPRVRSTGSAPELAQTTATPTPGNAVESGSVQGDIEAEFRQAEQHY